MSKKKPRVQVVSAGVRRRMDPRVARTRKALLEACAELCAGRGVSSITVSDIARRAGVNRTTFYLHYEDVTDLLQRGLESVLEEIAGSQKKKPAGMTDRDWLYMRIEHMFQTIEDRARFFRPLLSGSAGTDTRERIERFIEEFFIAERMPKTRSGSPDRAVLASRATASVLVGLASWWLEHPGQATAAQMADFYIRFVIGGIKGAGIT